MSSAVSRYRSARENLFRRPFSVIEADRRRSLSSSACLRLLSCSRSLIFGSSFCLHSLREAPALLQPPAQNPNGDENNPILVNVCNSLQLNSNLDKLIYV